jgi:hypothetical protein
MRNDQELFRHLVRRAFDKSWTGDQVVKAIYGFTMREHVDQAHPGDVEHVANLATLPMQPEARDAWLFGYRFCDTPPDPESTP